MKRDEVSPLLIRVFIHRLLTQYIIHQKLPRPHHVAVPDTAAPVRPSADTPSCADSACLCESHPPYAPRNSPVPYRPQSRRLTHHLPSASPGSPPSPAQPSAVRAASRPLMPGDSAFLGAALCRSRDNRLLRQSASRRNSRASSCRRAGQLCRGWWNTGWSARNRQRGRQPAPARECRT